MAEKCKTYIKSLCDRKVVETPFVAGNGIDIKHDLNRNVVISSTGGGTADINAGTGIEIDNNSNTISFDMPPWVVQNYENMGVSYIDGVALFSGNITFRYGTQEPYTNLMAGTTLPLPIIADEGVVIDVTEDGHSLEIHAERQQTLTTFSNLFTQLQTIASSGKRIKGIEFSPTSAMNITLDLITTSTDGTTTASSSSSIIASAGSTLFLTLNYIENLNAEFKFTGLTNDSYSLVFDVSSAQILMTVNDISCGSTNMVSRFAQEVLSNTTDNVIIHYE